MNKSAVINELKERTGLSKNDCCQVVDELLHLIVNTLSNGDEVRLTKFGTFKPHTQKPRLARNPKTGEGIEIPERVKVKFVPAQSLISSLNYT